MDAFQPIRPVPFGSTPDGREASLYRMCNGQGMTVEVTDIGGCVVSMRVPYGTGSFADVVLGYDGAERYATNAPNFGANVGRHANRIGGAEFELADERYVLAANEKGNSLHSGPDMWFTRGWEVVDSTQSPIDAELVLRLRSEDGDQGFPGELDMRVTYQLDNWNRLRITYDAKTSAPTIVNLTNHSYFNLNGHASGTALDHTLRIDAAAYTPTDDTLVPTGEIASVEGTPLDFREVRTLRSSVESGFASIDAAHGLDHNFVLADAGDLPGGLRRVAKLVGDKTGISMEVVTDAPGMQVYTGNFIEGELGKGGVVYHDYDAVCLETQYFPDAIHHANFKQPVFTPEHPYHAVTMFDFHGRG